MSGETAAPYGLNFNNDGTKLYVVGGGKIHQYTLNTPYDVSDVNGSAFTLDPTGFDSTPTGLTFNNDGTKVFVAGFNSRVIEVLHLSTAYDLSGTVTYDPLVLHIDLMLVVMCQGLEMFNLIKMVRECLLWMGLAQAQI